MHRLVRRSCTAAGVCRSGSATRTRYVPTGPPTVSTGVSVHTVSARLWHVDLRTTARYAAPRPERIDDIADALDRRHQAARRAGGVV